MQPAGKVRLGEIAADLDLSLDPEELGEFAAMAAGAVQMLQALDRVPDELPEVRYPRTPGRRPDGGENPHNAWYWRTSIEGAPQGPLAGRTIAIKDNVAVAGVPMMAGSSTLEGYTPEFDATVVERILDAGGTIVGKSHCEYFCYSGGSNTNATGPTLNPHDPTRTTGGSSSGSAALVAAGHVDLAIGSDQGGSVREPSALCGIYGMKPTHGLVPYTGALPMDPTLDHLGPMTQTVADNALLLSVIAGADDLDARQTGLEMGDYVGALQAGARGLRIGLVSEGFGQQGPEGTVRTDDVVREAMKVFADVGASVQAISVPMHRLGMAVWASISIHGSYLVSMRDNGIQSGVRGFQPTSLQDAHQHWRSQADKLSDNMKLGVMLGEYLFQTYGLHYYAKAQNLTRRLRSAYDIALRDVDVLVMPTTPTVAPRLPAADASRAERFVPGFDIIANTAPFNASGHPAMSVPCGTADGMPVGLMIVGRHWDEATVYRAATAFEGRAGKVAA